MNKAWKADKGWFEVPGLRPKGDRTLAEQMLGLERALAEAAGKTVLDLGCAEGLIGREFARAGAAKVVGVELLPAHLEVAAEACKGYPQMRFIQAHLDHYVKERPEPEQFDIVLALGVIHKLHDPNVPLRFAARSARSLLCFRAPAKKEQGQNGEYSIKSKFSDTRCNVPRVMREMGFVDEGTIDGVRGEAVQYWRRAAA